MRETKEAFAWIVSILRNLHIPFQVSGGLAARIHGSARTLADIDIDIPENDFQKLLPGIKRHVVFGPKRYKDRNWDIFLATLHYKGQLIDLGGYNGARIFDRAKKKWIRYPVKIGQAQARNVYGLRVPVISKGDLINYKSKLGRRVDKADLKQLLKN